MSQPLDRKSVERVEARLRTFHCRPEAERLVEKFGADRNELYQRLIQLADYSPRLEPKRPKTRKAVAAAKQIRATADLIDDWNNFRYSDLVWGSQREQTLAFPSVLRSYADRLQALPKQIAVQWQPVKVALIAQLVWYVKSSTNGYHDQEVSALISAFLYSSWDAEALKQWRKRHCVEINVLGRTSAVGLFPRPFTNRR